jgi:hypothetical protein
MNCPVCQCQPYAKRSLVSWLNRELALKLTCDALARLIQAGEKLVEQVIDACRRVAEEQQRPVPGAMDRLKVELNRLAQHINFNLKNPGETNEDQTESVRVVRELRTERARVEAELQHLLAAQDAKIAIPTPAEVRRSLKKLAKILTESAQSTDPSDTAILRRLIEDLTNGRIVMSQQGERKRQHGWLRGTFRVPLLGTVVDHITSGAVRCDDDGIEVSIDYKRPLKTDAKAEIAWQLHVDKKSNAEIARELGCCSPYVTKLLKIAAAKNGVEWVDGRSTPLNFPNRYKTPAIFKKIGHAVAALCAKDELLIEEIAAQFEVHVATVRKAIRWSYELRGLKVPNGRTRAGRIKEKRNQHEGSS